MKSTFLKSVGFICLLSNAIKSTNVGFIALSGFPGFSGFPGYLSFGGLLEKLRK